jgi:hypothetical protein
MQNSNAGKIEGGWAHMLQLFLGNFLLHPSGLAAGSVHVELDSGPRMIHARLANALADGEWHMIAWDWKGAGALKACIKHANVLKKVVSPRSHARTTLKHNRGLM